MVKADCGDTVRVTVTKIEVSPADESSTAPEYAVEDAASPAGLTDMVNVPPLRDADSQWPLTGENTTGVAVTARLLGAMVTDWVWLAGAVPPRSEERRVGKECRS